MRINEQSKYSIIYRSRACSTVTAGVASGGVQNERVCPRHQANAHFTAARDIWFSRAGVVYTACNDSMYHRPEKCVRDAHAKNVRDRVSGMHECSIMNFTYCCSLRIAAPPGEQLSLRFTCMNGGCLAWVGIE